MFLVAVIPLAQVAHATQKYGDIPLFRFYKMKTGQGIVSVVVPPTTTDGQLEGFLRFIRDKVQQGRFSDLGIRHPTDKRFGKLGYSAGVVDVYRGDECVNEQFLEDVGPCGYGEHDAASYQWGINGDPRKDSGLIRAKNGDLRKVF